MKKTTINDILRLVITLCVIFMAGAAAHQALYYTQTSGAWLTIPLIVAIIAAVLLNYNETDK